MNADERAAADRLESYVAEDERTDTCCDEIRTLLDALRRWDRLASEGLTEEEQQDIDQFREATYADSLVGESIQYIIAKLQAQLAAALDRVTATEGIASDVLEGQGLARIEDVRRETAGECARIVIRQAGWPTGNQIANIIRRRFKVHLVSEVLK